MFQSPSSLFPIEARTQSLQKVPGRLDFLVSFNDLQIDAD